MNNSKQHLKIKELRNRISKKPDIVDKIKAIESIGQKYKLDVLLIDDDDIGNHLYSKYLEGSNNVNNIVSMTCPVKAMEYLQLLHDNSKNFPKLILLDIEMPLISGSQFLEMFKNKNSIIYTTQKRRIIYRT